MPSFTFALGQGRVGLTLPRPPPSMVSLTIETLYFFLTTSNLMVKRRKNHFNFQIKKRTGWENEICRANLDWFGIPWISPQNSCLGKKDCAKNYSVPPSDLKLSLASGLGNLTSDSSVSGQVVKLVSKTWWGGNLTSQHLVRFQGLWRSWLLWPISRCCRLRTHPP